MYNAGTVVVTLAPEVSRQYCSSPDSKPSSHSGGVRIPFLESSCDDMSFQLVQQGCVQSSQCVHMHQEQHPMEPRTCPHSSLDQPEMKKSAKYII